jgi:hypothetical protein
MDRWMERRDRRIAKINEIRGPDGAEYGGVGL